MANIHRHRELHLESDPIISNITQFYLSPILFTKGTCSMQWNSFFILHNKYYKYRIEINTMQIANNLIIYNVWKNSIELLNINCFITYYFSNICTKKKKNLTIEHLSLVNDFASDLREWWPNNNGQHPFYRSRKDERDRSKTVLDQSDSRAKCTRHFFMSWK